MNDTTQVLKDKMITCVECGEEFQFTADEQQYYIDKEIVEPKRCGKCRNARRLKLDSRIKIYDDRVVVYYDKKEKPDKS